MARKQPARMLPPSLSPAQPGSDTLDYEANAATVVDLLNRHGKHIHWWHGEGEACRCVDPVQDPDDDGPPISVVIPRGDPIGSTSGLALAISRQHSWVKSMEYGWFGKYRLEFERELSASRPDILEAVRIQLEEAYRRQDGPVVVAILPEHVFVTTCIDRILAN